MIAVMSIDTNPETAVAADAVTDQPPKGGKKVKRHTPSKAALAQGTAERLRMKKPTREKCPVVLDGALADELRAARERHDLAKMRLEASPDDASRDKEFVSAKRALDELADRARDQVVDVWFTSIGSVAWEKLRDDHPLQDETRRRLVDEGVKPSEMPVTDPKSFPPAAIAACAREAVLDDDGNVVALADEPMWDIDTVRAMFDDPDWNDGELQSLYYTAVNANTIRKVADLPKD